MGDIDALRMAWEQSPDGENGHEYGEALEDEGRVEEAAAIYRALIASEFLIGYADLAWLEHERGNHRLAEELLESYLEADDDPDESTATISGLLGHWRWNAGDRFDAEPLLRAGAEFYPEARSDLAALLRASDREDEAETVLRAGVIAGEVDSHLPLGNLLWESERVEEAEEIYLRGYTLGDAFSAYNLSLLLTELGRDEEASIWMRKAAEGGDEKAISSLEHH